MSAKFVMLANPHNNKPVLVNSDHVRTASESAPNVVTLVMDGGLHQNVEGDLKSVWEKLTGKVSTLEAIDEHLTWTRRDPEVDSGGH